MVIPFLCALKRVFEDDINNALFVLIIALPFAEDVNIQASNHRRFVFPRPLQCNLFVYIPRLDFLSFMIEGKR